MKACEACGKVILRRDDLVQEKKPGQGGYRALCSECYAKEREGNGGESQHPVGSAVNEYAG